MISRHGFGPTALSEAVRHRLDAPALNALAELETFDADAVVQCLEQAGLTVRNPTAYVIKAVERVRRGGMPGIGIRSRCFNCGEPGHLARDCPSDCEWPPRAARALPDDDPRCKCAEARHAASGCGTQRGREPPPRRAAMRLLAQLETADADEIAHEEEEAGGTVRNPSGYVMKAVERVRRGGTAGSGAVGQPPRAARRARARMRTGAAARHAAGLAGRCRPPSARGSTAPRPGDWICGVCTNHNFASRIECNRCGTPKSGERPTAGSVGFVPRPTRRRRSRSRSRERRRRVIVPALWLLFIAHGVLGAPTRGAGVPRR